MVVIYGKVYITESEINAATPNVKQTIFFPFYKYPEGDVAVVEVGGK